MTDKKLSCYETDASRLVGNVERVVFPKNAREVQQIIRSAEFDVVVRGAGSNLVGGCIPKKSIVVDMGKMDKVSKFNLEKQNVYVEAGITVKELNEKLKKAGFEFPIIPLNYGISTIGGMISVNASGKKGLKYGKIKNLIEEIDFVNGRGELMKVGRADLMDVCGMEGITGIIIGAVLKIIPMVKKSASIFQTDSLDEILSIARRLKLEKEVSMLMFFPKEVSKLLGFPEKYHLIIGFDSNRGKIKGEEYGKISKLSDKCYYVLYSEGYYNSEDPKFFFDKLKDFVLLLERRKIPYFGDLGVGVIHPFFKDEEKEKREEVVKFIKKSGGKFDRYGIGIKRKDYLDNFEIKIIQRVKLRHDPFGKLSKGKVVDISKIPKEVKSSEGEAKTASQVLEEIKADEKSEMEEMEDSEVNIEETKYPKGKSDLEETKNMIKDYESTFKSEISEEKKKKVEEIAKEISREITKKPVEEKFEKQEEKKVRPPVDYDEIKDIMTNKYGFDVQKGEFEVKEEDKKERDSKDDRDFINKIMTNRKDDEK